MRFVKTINISSKQVHLRQVDGVPVRGGHRLPGGPPGRARGPGRPVRLQHAQARAALPRRRPKLGRPLAGRAKVTGRREILQLQVHVVKISVLCDNLSKWYHLLLLTLVILAKNCHNHT